MLRPRAVTILVVLVLSLAAANLLGAIGGLRRYTLLAQLPLSLPPAYLVAASAFWALLFGLLAAGLWRVKSWARIGMLAAFSLYIAAAWIERLMFGSSDYLRTSAPFYMALHALSLALVWGILMRRKVRRAFSA